MYRREINSYEDPWISLEDHPNKCIYGANSFLDHSELLLNGPKVFIRNSLNSLSKVICRDNDISENLSY